MLEFEPEVRCTASEALSHEYFWNHSANMGPDNLGKVSNLKDKVEFEDFEKALEKLLQDPDDCHATRLKGTLRPATRMPIGPIKLTLVALCLL